MSAILIIIYSIIGISLIVSLLKGFKDNLIGGILTLAAAALSIIAAVTLTNYISTSFIQGQLLKANGDVAEYFASDSKAAQNLLTLGIALVKPIAFTVIYVICFTVLSVIKSIIKKLFFNTKTVFFTSKILALVANLAAGCICVCAFTIPVTFITDTLIKNEDTVSQLSDENIVTGYNKHFLSLKDNQAYAFISSINSIFNVNLTKMQTGDQQEVLIEDCLGCLASIIITFTDVDEIGKTLITPQNCYKIADSLQANTFMDNTVGVLLADACTAWEKGDDFLGAKPLDLGNEQITKNAYAACKNNDFAHVTFNTIGSLLLMIDIYSGEKVDVNDVITLFENLDSSSAEMLTSLMSDDVIESMGAIGKTAEALINTIPNFAQEKDEQSLLEEAQHIANLIDYVSGNSNLDVTDVVDSICSSEVLDSVLSDLVEENSDILQIEVSEEVKAQILAIMQDYGLTEEDQLYKAITKIFGIE